MRFGALELRRSRRRSSVKIPERDARRASRQRKQVSGEHGQSEVLVATIEPVEETVTPLTCDELQPIAHNAELAIHFINHFQVVEKGPWTLADLDKAFGVWLNAADKFGYTPESVTEILGAAFGQHCAVHLWPRLFQGNEGG